MAFAVGSTLEIILLIEDISSEVTDKRRVAKLSLTLQKLCRFNVNSISLAQSAQVKPSIS
jgi:hypothetical protein